MDALEVAELLIEAARRASADGDSVAAIDLALHAAGWLRLAKLGAKATNGR